MRRKDRSGRWTVPPTGHKKGGGIQGISAASVARAETLSDALGTRLHYWRTVPRPQSRIYDVSLQDLLRPRVRSWFSPFNLDHFYLFKIYLNWQLAMS